MHRDQKQVIEKLRLAVSGFDATAVGRLAHKIIAASREGIADVELQIVRHRAFNRQADAARCEAWLQQHRRDMEVG